MKNRKLGKPVFFRENGVIRRTFLKGASAARLWAVLLCLGACQGTPAQAILTATTETKFPVNSDAHSTFTVERSDGTCLVHGISYTTALDCALTRAQAFANQYGQAASVVMGAGTFETKIGLQMIEDRPQTINIRGAGKGEFGGGTVVRLVKPLSTAVISYPPLSPSKSSGYWNNVNLQGFTVDANGEAPMCLDLNALRVAHLQDLSCMGAVGDEAWIRIGGTERKYGGHAPDGFVAVSFQVMASDIFVYHNGFTSDAEVSARVELGRIAGYTVTAPGHFREQNDIPVSLKGVDAATPPCVDMPKGVVGHLARDKSDEFYHLVSIGQEYGGSGCTEPVLVVAMDMPKAEYGFQIAATDSSFYDLTDDSVGRIAGISDRASQGSLFVHPHVWKTWGGIDLWGGETLLTPELDSVYGYGMRFRWGTGSVVENPTFVYVERPVYRSMAEFVFEPSAEGMTISNEACNEPDPNAGHVQFAKSHDSFDLGYGPTASDRNDRISPHALPRGLIVTANTMCGKGRKVAEDTSIDVEGQVNASDRSARWTVVNKSSKPASLLVATLPARRSGAPASALRLAVDQLNDSDGASGEVGWVTNSHRVCAMEKMIQGASAIRVYLQIDGTLKVYLSLPPRSSSASVLDMIQNSETHLEVTPKLEHPTGEPIEGSQNCERAATQP